MDSNQITDLSPLKTLTNLQILYCRSNGVTDLSPISGLAGLQIIYCNSNDINSISPISKLANLQLFCCDYNQIKDLSPISKLTNLQILSCSSNRIKDLSSIKKLTELQMFSCESNQITDLSPIAQLTKLKMFFCESNHVRDLSPIVDLSNLKKLSCGSNQITDLSPIVGLTNLQELSCDSNQITDLSPIVGLTNLKKLSCNSNQITDLSPIVGLTNLKKLSCNSNQISDLSPIVGLTNLQELSCYYNRIGDLSPVSTLTNLRSLNFHSNQICDLLPLAALINLKILICPSNQITDLSPIVGLTNLQELHCHSNQIADLSPVSILTNLQLLDCVSNQIFDLSPVFFKIKEGLSVKWGHESFDFENSGIYIKDCPLIIPPIEFAQAGNEAILEYFEQLGEDRTPLNEIKVIFLGEGAAGKTSLVKRIRKEPFNAKESQTHGIRIRKTDFVVGEDTIKAHIWDFGGQEVMHATHQFFLSRRCVYVLVLNSRTDEKAEYWLKHASSFGGNSPVLVVLNKMDENPGYDVNRKQLLEKYPQIVNFYKVSCKENQGVEEFSAALTRQIAQSDTRRTPFPKAWGAVKDHFVNMKEDFIESSVYRKVCSDHGVERAFSQDVLLQFLHDLGVVINFKHLKNFDTQILNPLWLTNGVYRIINSAIVAQNKGLLHEEELDSVINDPRYSAGNTQDNPFHYPKNKLTYIIKVMEVFELCSRLDAYTYVVPQLLPVDEPSFELEGTVLHFVLRFPEFLPDSVFPRLMVKLNPYIKDALRWRTGMVLYKPTIFKAHARIRADKEDKEIRIDLCGEEPRRLLSYIRATIEEIAADFAKLEYAEMVPVPGTKESMEYQYLLEAEKAGQRGVFIRGKGITPIADLLNGVEEAEMRDQAAQMPVNVFISYAHKDDEFRQELRTALSPLERLNKLKIWDDRDINAGSEWEKEIFRELEAADIVLCLVSADFIQSEFCYSKELKLAMEAHEKGKKVVVPIRLRKCAWEALDIAKLQGTPTSEWITSSGNKDEVWTEVAHHLEPLIGKLKEWKWKYGDNIPF
jgi:internalin A